MKVKEIRKLSGRAVFIHIPTIKNVDEQFIDRVKAALDSYLANGKDA